MAPHVRSASEKTMAFETFFYPPPLTSRRKGKKYRLTQHKTLFQVPFKYQKRFSSFLKTNKIIPNTLTLIGTCLNLHIKNWRSSILVKFYIFHRLMDNRHMDKHIKLPSQPCYSFPFVIDNKAITSNLRDYLFYF